MIELQLRKQVSTAVQPSARVLAVAGMFGLGVDERRTLTLVEPTRLRLTAGQVTFITGPSGSGKSTLLRLIKAGSRARAGARVLDFAELPALDERPVVDCLDADLKTVMRWLSLAGLNDAFVMLRTPGELSDGQRYRLKMAQMMEQVEGAGGAAEEGGEQLVVVLADEFGATLDRVTAKVLARNARKWASRSGVALVVATTHDDLLESLEPDVLVEKHLDEKVSVAAR